MTEMARDLASEGLELKIGGVCEKYSREKRFLGSFVVAKKEDGFYFFFEPESILPHGELAWNYGLVSKLGIRYKPAAPWECIVGGGDVSYCEEVLHVGGTSETYGSIPLEMAKEYALKVKEYLIAQEVEVKDVGVRVHSDLKPHWKKYLGEGYFKILEEEQRRLIELSKEIERIESGKGRGLLYEEILK